MFENQNVQLPARVALGAQAWEDTWAPSEQQMLELGHIAPDGENPVTDTSGATAIFESYWAGEISEVRAGEMLREWTRSMGLTTIVERCLGGGNPHTLCSCTRCVHAR